MKCVLGRKLGMVQLFDKTGKIWPATVVYCEPNKIIDVKNNHVVVGFEVTSNKKINKSQIGFFKKNGLSNCFKEVHEFNNINNCKKGDELTVSQFKAGEFIDAQGRTKGRGFTGAIKRWNFKIGPLGHGAGYPHRYQGSIAMGRGGSQAQRVKKGQKMSGHYGNELVTIQNLLVLYVNSHDNTITIHGAIPGHKNSIVLLRNAVKSTKTINPVEIITKENMDEVKEKSEALFDKEMVKKQNLAIDKQEEQEKEKKSEKSTEKSN